jgi:NADPH-dependent curcumin reductase CurA
MELRNRRVVLAKRPVGEPDASCFAIETVPVSSPEQGEMLLRILWLSVDPYMRGRMNEGPSYAPPVALGEVMVGGTVSEVVESRATGFKVGDIVTGYHGWQEYALAHGEEKRLYKVDPSLAPISTAVGVLGMPGHTAYFGLLRVGKPKPGETVVVSAASGAVGSVVGQLAKIHGCRAVGIAGGADKCAYVKDALGFDACIDYKGGRLAEDLKAACPAGIDVYFENVGGPVLDAVAPLLNDGARVPICGFISGYNATAPVKTPFEVLGKHPKKPEHRFLLVNEWIAEFPDATRKLGALVKQGRLKYRETVTEGIENAPKAFLGLFSGQNFGKQLVKVAEPSTRKR